MKFYPSQLNILLDKISKGQITSILLFGPDKGYITEICRMIVKQLDLVTTSLSYNEINANSLSIFLNARNFFNKREFIKITSVSSSIDVNIKTLLSSKFTNFAAFISDELAAGCSIRVFFENNNSSASVACYTEDEQNLTRIIQRKITSASKVIDQNALLYLSSCLKGDYQLINSELDKLISYVDAQKVITIKDVMLVIADDLTASGDDLCTYFAEKDSDKVLIELEKLNIQGINTVLIIRALIRYYLNLYIVRSKLEEGEAIDNAIASLSPPIFYKRINNFKKIAINIKIVDIVSILNLLQQAEVRFKMESKNFDFFEVLRQRL